MRRERRKRKKIAMMVGKACGETDKEGKIYGNCRGTKMGGERRRERLTIDRRSGDGSTRGRAEEIINACKDEGGKKRND